MTTPVNASANASAFSNVLKMRQDLGGKHHMSELPILLIKSQVVSCFYVPATPELEVFYTLKRHHTPPYEPRWLFGSWVCLFPLQHLETR